MSYRKMEQHSFYCMNCGNKAYELMRPRSHQYGKHHRKALYCPYCKTTVNHIEITNLEEVDLFKENFQKGLYKEEAKESICYLKSSI